MLQKLKHLKFKLKELCKYKWKKQNKTTNYVNTMKIIKTLVLNMYYRKQTDSVTEWKQWKLNNVFGKWPPYKDSVTTLPPLWLVFIVCSCWPYQSVTVAHISVLALNCVFKCVCLFPILLLQYPKTDTSWAVFSSSLSLSLNYSCI